jgi:hypothetical protein
LYGACTLFESSLGELTFPALEEVTEEFGSSAHEVDAQPPRTQMHHNNKPRTTCVVMNGSEELE